MAVYMHGQYLAHINNADAFNTIHSPSDRTPFSGIYRCECCGKNDVSTQGHALPPQNHHQHNPAAPIRWRLVVATH